MSDPSAAPLPLPDEERGTNPSILELAPVSLQLRPNPNRRSPCGAVSSNPLSSLSLPSQRFGPTVAVQFPSSPKAFVAGTTPLEHDTIQRETSSSRSSSSSSSSTEILGCSGGLAPVGVTCSSSGIPGGSSSS
eukprot:RCo051170